MSKLERARVLVASSAILLAGVIGCGDTAGPVRRAELTLRLTTDSAYITSHCPVGSYCTMSVPDSGTMTARLVMGRETVHDSEIIGTIDEVEFADSLVGTAVIDVDSVMTVEADLPPWYNWYDDFRFTGKMTNGQYSGRWRQWTSPHGPGYGGSFVTVP